MEKPRSLKLRPEFIRRKQADRLYGLPIPLIGLTGGIATGKSSVTRILRQKGYAVIDADQLVKTIYKRPDIRTFVAKICPSAVSPAEIDFSVLREKFFSNPTLKASLESRIYQELPKAFLAAYAELQSPEFVFYDVPLLFEKNLAEKVDATVVVYAPCPVQLSRLILRDGIGRALAEEILGQQWDIEDKKSAADLIIDNSKSEEDLASEVALFLKSITSGDD